MADDVAITAGSGTTIATDDAAGRHVQLVKLTLSADGSATHLTADNTNGLLVDVSRIQADVSIDDGGNVISVDDGAGSLTVDDGSGSLTVDAPVATPVFVRLSDGASAITALPVTDNSSTLSVDDGGGVLTVDGTVAATQSGTWNVATLTTITNDVNIADGGNVISVDDGGATLTVDGTVAVTQSTAAASSGGWPVKITDGTNDVTNTLVGSDYALDVNVVQGVGVAGHQDKTTFTEGTTEVAVIGAVRNDTPVGAPSDNQAAHLRMTSLQALYVTPLDSSGNEKGIAASPWKVDADHQAKTIKSIHAAYTASQTNQTLITPTAGKKFIVWAITIKATAGGSVEIFDETNASTSTLFAGTLATEDIVVLPYPQGRISSTINNKLEYDTGTGATGDITVYATDSD